MIFFTSDSHFNGYNVLKREKRPFKSVEECDKQIIKIWNKQVKKGDIIYHLGDFITYVEENANEYEMGLNYVKKIKADVILIIGNNEERIIKNEFNNDFEKFRNFCINLGFKDVKEEEFLEFEDHKFYLNHRPSKHKDGYINFFGHLHKVTGLYKPFGLNVACDMHYFTLCTANELIDMWNKKQKMWDKDVDVLS